jgi:hypothetical protein
MSTASNGPPPACTPSQYNLDDDAPLLVSQYREIASSISG